MATYASAEELSDYLSDSDSIDASEGASAERLLLRAEEDVDLVIGPIPRDETTGRKIDPADLSDAQTAALSRATCAQAQWLLAMDEGDLIGEEDGILSAA